MLRLEDLYNALGRFNCVSYWVLLEDWEGSSLKPLPPKVPSSGLVTIALTRVPSKRLPKSSGVGGSATLVKADVSDAEAIDRSN